MDVMPAPLSIALGLLTRLPTPAVQVQPALLSRSLRWFPWVGGVLAVPLCAVLWFAAEWWSVGVAAALATATWASLTGALHLDGIADSADGLSAGHRDRARALAVMRDSHIGAHGAVALTLVILLKFGACMHWMHLPLAPLELGAGLLLTTAAPRTWTAVALASFPTAAGSSMAASFGGPGARGAASIAVASLLLLALGAFALAPQRSLHIVSLLAVSAAATFWMGHAATRRFGGLTGDLCGAMIELGEVLCLLAWGVHG